MKICIVIAILGRNIEGKWFSTLKWFMWIRVSGRQIDDFETLGTGTITGSDWWGSRHRWRRRWSWLSIASGVCSGVCCLRRFGGGVPDSLHHLRVCWMFAVQFWQERHPGVWFWRSIAGCLCFAAFNFYAQQTQHPASSLLRPCREVSWLGTGFPLLRHSKTLLWPLWPCSRPGACQTVPAEHNLLALPS